MHLCYYISERTGKKVYSDIILNASQQEMYYEKLTVMADFDNEKTSIKCIGAHTGEGVKDIFPAMIKLREQKLSLNDSQMLTDKMTEMMGWRRIKVVFIKENTRYYGRLQKTHGDARYKCTMTLCSDGLNVGTVLHEIAHYDAWEKTPKIAHGKVFRKNLRKLIKNYKLLCLNTKVGGGKMPQVSSREGKASSPKKTSKKNVSTNPKAPVVKKERENKVEIIPQNKVEIIPHTAEEMKLLVEKVNVHFEKRDGTKGKGMLTQAGKNWNVLHVTELNGETVDLTWGVNLNMIRFT